MRRNGSTDAGRLNGFPSPENLKTLTGFTISEKRSNFPSNRNGSSCTSRPTTVMPYVNGEMASVGPARGDVFNWNFETVDLARWLKPGKIRWQPSYGTSRK